MNERQFNSLILILPVEWFACVVQSLCTRTHPALYARCMRVPRIYEYDKSAHGVQSPKSTLWHDGVVAWWCVAGGVLGVGVLVY